MRHLNVVVLGAVTAGCGYPEYSFVAEASDAQADTAAAIVSDGNLDDAIAADVPDARDAIVMESDALDSARPCAHLFCADFDSVPGVTVGWEETNVTTPGGAIELEPGGRSAPNSFLARADPFPAGVIMASLQHNHVVPTLDTTVRVGMWIKLEAATFPGESVYLTKLGHNGEGATLSLDATGFFVETHATPSADYRIDKAVPVGTWFFVRIDAKLRAIDGAFTVWIDDLSTPVFSKSGLSTLVTDSLERKMVVGLYAAKGTSTFRVRYDDVWMDYLP